MPALNFKKEFAPKVESGEKRQTIRAIKKTPFKTGDILYLYTGMRTRSCRKLGEAKALEVLPVEITTRSMRINGVLQLNHDSEKIAKEDGFDSFFDMMYWFFHTHGLPFEGQLIKW